MINPDGLEVVNQRSIREMARPDEVEVGVGGSPMADLHIELREIGVVITPHGIALGIVGRETVTEWIHSDDVNDEDEGESEVGGGRG